uniref:Uncharacterized protein n=1 Tax=Knipowitschia caucasica TaxID=637954 RepID=A0AAV2IV79_KNICA
MYKVDGSSLGPEQIWGLRLLLGPLETESSGDRVLWRPSPLETESSGDRVLCSRAVECDNGVCVVFIERHYHTKQLL